MPALTAEVIDCFFNTPKNQKYLAYSKIHLVWCDFTPTINSLLKKEYSLEQLIVLMHQVMHPLMRPGKSTASLSQFFTGKAQIFLQALCSFINFYNPKDNKNEIDFEKFEETVSNLMVKMNNFRVYSFILKPLSMYYEKVDETITPNRKIRDRGDGLRQLFADVFNHMEEIQIKLPELLDKNVKKSQVKNNVFVLLFDTQPSLRQAAQHVMQLYEGHLQSVNALSAYIADAGAEKKTAGEKNIFAILRQTLQSLPWFPSVILAYPECSSLFDASKSFFCVQICYSMGDIFEPPRIVRTEYTAPDKVNLFYRFQLDNWHTIILMPIRFEQDEKFLALLITLLDQSIKLIHRSVSVPNISPCLPLIGPESNHLRKLDACQAHELIGLFFLCMLYTKIFLPLEEEKIGSAQTYMRHLALFYQHIYQEKQKNPISDLVQQQNRERFFNKVILKKSSTPEPRVAEEISKLVTQFPDKTQGADYLQQYCHFFHSYDQYSHAPAETTDNNAEAALGADSAPLSVSKDAATTVRNSML